MESRYLFRAKRIDNGQWVQGAVLYHDDTATIFNQHPADGSLQGFEVDINTICQCTGLKDKNGNLIWENDIAFVKDEDGYSGQMDTGIGEISFLEGLWYIEGGVQNGLFSLIDRCFQIEVIGNSFDNPELLMEEEKEI